MKIILISGYAQNGKDTFGNLLSNYLPNSKIFQIAGPIKELAAKYFDWNGVKDSKGRRLLQELGRIGRDYNEDLWINKTIEKIKESQDLEYVIITDWRFKNEYEAIIRNFGQENTIKIRVYKSDVPILNDISEHDLDDYNDYDYIVINNKDLDFLDKVAKKISEQILEQKEIESSKQSVVRKNNKIDKGEIV